MRVTIELRVNRKYSNLLFTGDDGPYLDERIQLVKLDANDIRFAQVGELQRNFAEKYDDSFFFGWNITRNYTSAEKNAATIFALRFTHHLGIFGEEYGTRYDKNTACELCGSGAVQIGLLRLPRRKFPRNKDIARTMAGEMVISSRFMSILEENRITGLKFDPISLPDQQEKYIENWSQMSVLNCDAEIVAPTLVGNDPFDHDIAGEGRCPRGDLLGLNSLSEVTISRAAEIGNDVIATRQFVGTRRGLLRPERIILLSQKARQAIEAHNIRGLRLEIAHVC